MGRRVSIDGLADAVMQELDNYADTTTEGVKAAVKKAANTVKKEITAGARNGLVAMQKAGGLRPQRKVPLLWRSPYTRRRAICWHICWSMDTPCATVAGSLQRSTSHPPSRTALKN